MRSEPRSIVLELYATPPSLNKTGSRGSWRTFHRIKKAWEQDIWTLIVAQGPTQQMRSPCSVHALLRFPQRRRRDEGNFKVLLEKACGDAMVLSGLIPDDTPDHYRFREVRFDPEPGPPFTVITIEEDPL